MDFSAFLLAKRPRIGYAMQVKDRLRGVFSLTQTLATAIQCAILAMMPVVELRAALPWAIASGLNPWFSYVLCVLFNMLPVPFILLFLNKILAWNPEKGKAPLPKPLSPCRNFHSPSLSPCCLCSPLQLFSKVLGAIFQKHWVHVIFF